MSTQSDTPGAGRVIDIHAHHVPLTLVNELERDAAAYGVRLDQLVDGRRRIVMRDGEHLPPLLPELLDLEGRLDWLDLSGIDVQVLSPWSEIAGYHLPAAQGAAWTRLQNETLVEAARSNGARYRAMGGLPMQDVPRALEEIRHCVGRLGLRAFQVTTNVNGRDLDAPEFRPFWKLVRELDVLIFLHPPVHQMISDRLDDFFLSNLVGVPVDTTIAACRLILSGLLEELPGLRILLAHGGGMVPYQVGRLDCGYRTNPLVSAHIHRRPSEFLDAFLYDTVLFDEAALGLLIEQVPSENILFGTDHPFPIRDDEMLARLSRLDRIEPAAMEAILGGSAQRLGLV